MPSVPLLSLLRPLAERLLWQSQVDHAERGRVSRQTLEPVHCAISLCLLSVYPPGSKLSIRDHGVIVQQAGLLQGYERTRYGDSFEDLTMLRRPLLSCATIAREASGDRAVYLKQIIQGAVKGLDTLVQTYHEMARKDARLLAKFRAVRDLIELYRSFLESPQNEQCSADEQSSFEQLNRHFEGLWTDSELCEVCTLFALSIKVKDDDTRASALLKPVDMLLRSKLDAIEDIVTRYQRGGEA